MWEDPSLRCVGSVRVADSRPQLQWTSSTIFIRYAGTWFEFAWVPKRARPMHRCRPMHASLPVRDPLDLTPQPTLAPARLRGALLVSALRWLTDNHGLPAIGAIYGALPRRDQDRLETVQKDEWYSLRTWETFLHVADEVLGRGDLAL